MSFLRKTTVLGVSALTATATAIAAPAVAGATTTHGGAPIVITADNGAQGLCTLNSVAVSGGTYYGITAGHCLDPEEFGGQPVEISTDRGELLADADDIAAGGHILDGGANVADPNAGLDDFGWFRLDESVTPDVNGISSRANTGIPLLDPLLTGQRLETGDPVPVTPNLVGGLVCKDGARTGRTCGPVLSVNAESQEVFAAIPAIAGDSGSPLYILGTDGRIHIVGTLSNGSPVLFNVFDGMQDHLHRVGA
ncbi:hypothetical protein [uncultured Corynebacterium sp.]|uniref:hypothetical protein n=1 Tax=uncultured Corynebacterium sp. TaxID=159447 RepID=UPI0025E6DF22|nr:hypothetical protein [uncultured Corynebacterium sp.]